MLKGAKLVYLLQADIHAEVPSSICVSYSMVKLSDTG